MIGQSSSVIQFQENPALEQIKNVVLEGGGVGNGPWLPNVLLWLLMTAGRMCSGGEGGRFQNLFCRKGLFSVPWLGKLLGKVILLCCVSNFASLTTSFEDNAGDFIFISGGLRRISGISYSESSDFPRRSLQFAWRASVEMSRNASQLALQVSLCHFYLII